MKNNINEQIHEAIAIWLYNNNCDYSVSCLIDEDTITAGYGEIDYIGCFEYNLPSNIIKEIYGTTSWNEKNHPNFTKLWRLKCADIFGDCERWWDYKIYAQTTKDVVMRVWNGHHPAENNMTEHICKAGTKVRVWMVSRFGDAGITDNITNPNGYDTRVDPDTDLDNYSYEPI